MKIGIYGYGNLGRGVEAALRQNPDMEIVGVFTRRDPASVETVTGIGWWRKSSMDPVTSASAPSS